MSLLEMSFSTCVQTWSVKHTFQEENQHIHAAIDGVISAVGTHSQRTVSAFQMIKNNMSMGKMDPPSLRGYLVFNDQYLVNIESV